MAKPELKTGLDIQVEVSLGETKRQYPSKITELDRDMVFITCPALTNIPDEAVLPGMACRVVFSLKEGRYAFDAQIATVSQGLIGLSRPETFYDWKRQHVRFDASIWLRYTVIQRDELPPTLDTYVRTYSQTRNVSGGGLLMPISDSRIRKAELKTTVFPPEIRNPKSEIGIGTLMELELELPTEPEPVLSIGRVVHTSESGYGVEFLLIDEIDRERLVKYIFAQERLSRQLAQQDETELD